MKGVLLALLAISMTGCGTVMNAVGLPHQTHEQYATIESICKEAQKNEARANDMHANKTIVSAQGKFNYIKSMTSDNYSPYIDFDTYYFTVHMRTGTEDGRWKQYDKGQLVESGERMVKSVTVENTHTQFNRRDLCIISTIPVTEKGE